MPLYHYVCDKCEHEFDDIVRLDEEDPSCLECGGETDRQISAPTLKFKGSGFYTTDYPKD